MSTIFKSKDDKEVFTKTSNEIHRALGQSWVTRSITFIPKNGNLVRAVVFKAVNIGVQLN